MIFQLEDDLHTFPHPKYAEDDGLLAVGGDLSPQRLLAAYQNGIFPWYSEETPILWYAPHKRFVLDPKAIKISKSMHKVLLTAGFEFTYNTAFNEVLENCSSIDRNDQDGTWIIPAMKEAYTKLHKLGFAHSIEVWQNKVLVGGLYGVLVGHVFCGESMFTKVSNASKAALIYLAKHFQLELIDCQVHTDHLESMGARMIQQAVFLQLLQNQQIKAHGLQKTI